MFIKSFFKFIVVEILTIEARIVLWKYKPSIISVTGSVGKTSTKDAVYAALEDSLYIRKSEKSFNGEIGIPLTVLGCPTGWNNPFKWLKNIFTGLALILLPNHYPKWLVLEVGADHPGDIERISKWLHSDVVIITSLPDIPVHVAHFKSPQEVITEKLYLIKTLKNQGTLILNGDDKNTRELKERYPDIYTLLYGLELHNDVAATHVAIDYDANKVPCGMKFNVEERGSSMPVSFKGRLGPQQVIPIVAAFATARVVGVSPLMVVRSLKKGCGSPGRMRILSGHNDSTIIDDSYNSSPEALRAALTVLKKIETKGKKWAIIGDMRELGNYSKKAHQKAGVYVASIADELVTVGEESLVLATAAREAGMAEEHIHSFGYDESAKAGRFVRKHIQPNDIILGKGSQNHIRIERAVRELLKDVTLAKTVLVRQDDEWNILRRNS